MDFHYICIFSWMKYTYYIMNEYFQTPKEERIKILQLCMHEAFNKERTDQENLKYETRALQKNIGYGQGVKFIDFIADCN